MAALCLNFGSKAQNPIEPPPLKNQGLMGKVITVTGEALPGAILKITYGNQHTFTDKNGVFFLSLSNGTYQITAHYVGYKSKTISIQIPLKEQLLITLEADENNLKEVEINAGYYTVKDKERTGSISTITAETIANQPVTNVLSVLSGRMPGVFVQTTNGLPGGNINIQIRGKGSITAGTNPLYIIDGVPFNTKIGPLNTATSGLATQSINGMVSPLNSLNPDDIESISILKDADATAIYGSRGSNGVVLITTKKGKEGKTTISFKASQGVNRIANLPKLLNLEEYLQMRKEAYLNDGIIPSDDPLSDNYAPDLKVWGNSVATNWPKYMLGKTGAVTNVQATVSAGTALTNFSLSGNLRSENTILPGKNLYRRGGIQSSLSHHSPDNRFSVQLANIITLDNNVLSNPSTDAMVSAVFLPPNYPLYDSSGSLNWSAGINPKGVIKASSNAQTENSINNLALEFKILPNLSFKTSAGYNSIRLNQIQRFPMASLYPGSINYSNFGDNSTRTYLVEPQFNYTANFKTSTLQLLIGGTWQNSLSKGEFINAQNFSNEGLMENLSSAGTLTTTNLYTAYKYISFFGRAGYSYQGKYILNATIRRDGSSRFGPGNQFGNFGSIGTAWLFSKERWLVDHFSMLSSGKLRASYGVTGNDQIAPYQYMSTYNSGNIYEGISGLKPSRIANANFHWESTRKAELALELGFFKDRILFNVNYYINRSNDQLVNYNIPYQTGFASYQANLPAVVQNTGLEIELNTKNIQQKDFSWQSNFNISVPKNKLLSFENFENSSYAQSLELGYDITRSYGYKYLGTDPNSGLAQYADKNGNASADPYGYFTMGKRSPDFYGGVGNTLNYKNWQLDIFGQFAKQKLQGGLMYTVGQAVNSYRTVLDTWKNIGDESLVPKSSLNTDFNYGVSSANYFNAAYFRIKNISLSYTFSSKWLEKLHLNRLQVYAQAQNIFTFWHKNGALLDPESGALTTINPNIPPMKSIISGLQLTF